MEQVKDSKLKKMLSKDRAKNVLHIKSISSTNSYLRETVNSKTPHGYTVVAQAQTKGRGRYDRSFVSLENKGIYMSYLMRADANIGDISVVTAYTAVAVRKAIKKLCGVTADIKWVNDLLLNGKKVCGILCESAVDANGKVDYIIIGIGVNVSQSQEDFPLELMNIATSIEEISGKKVCLDELTAEIINQLDIMCKSLKYKQLYYLYSYKKACITVDKQLELEINNNKVCGKCIGIDNKLRLKVITSDKKQITVSSGEANIIKK